MPSRADAKPAKTEVQGSYNFRNLKPASPKYLPKLQPK